ncbi:ATP-binding protein [Eggerthella sinensis]|uniref:ATP-binding protein n=1 Tax=Eggerthella sinensis TaxID=242230 RepID=UPI0022E5EEF2|nr:hypothetical protein [Eggerthella sinensis]
MADAPDNMPEQADGPSADAESRPNQIVVLRDYCTRTHGAACDRCALACPHDAISFAEDGRPVIDADACTRCGICLGICDAFSSSRVTMIDVHARIRRIALRGEDVVLTCKENIFPGLEPAANVVVLPCLACLSPEFWTLVLTENIPVRISADLAYCAECDRAGDMGEMLYSHAVQTAEEWSGQSVGYLDVIPEKENLVKDLANPEASTVAARSRTSWAMWATSRRASAACATPRCCSSSTSARSAPGRGRASTSSTACSSTSSFPPAARRRPCGRSASCCWKPSTAIPTSPSACRW